MADHILMAGILASLGKVAKVAADAVIAVRIRFAFSLSVPIWIFTQTDPRAPPPF